MTSINSQRWLTAAVLAVVASLGTFGLIGCERKEKVLEVNTPGTNLEVERNIDTGEVEVETNRN